jgi:hypothetical protein
VISVSSQGEGNKHNTARTCHEWSLHTGQDLHVPMHDYRGNYFLVSVPINLSTLGFESPFIRYDYIFLLVHICTCQLGNIPPHTE